MSRNNDEVLGHADESDGIEEYDNPLPDWWVGMFIVCVVWGVAYAVDFHFISQRSQASMYDAEVAAAKELWPDLEKRAVADSSPEALALGAEVYQGNCLACHGAELKGGIGPNLTDDVWVHGGDFDAVSTTITQGVGAKGMPAWGPILGPKKVAAVASFVLSKYEAGQAAPDPAATTAAAPAPTDGAPLEGDALLARGEEVFAANCVACHQADMTGGIGPNLVDAEWIHGGSLADITKVVTEGVPAKGMLTWKGVLADQDIDAVSAYVFAKANP